MKSENSEIARRLGGELFTNIGDGGSTRDARDGLLVVDEAASIGSSRRQHRGNLQFMLARSRKEGLSAVGPVGFDGGEL